MAQETRIGARHAILTWASPSVQDLVFYHERNMSLPEYRSFKYGEPHPDKSRFPDHKLVFVSPQDEEMWSRWYYAADRENQDAYNWELVDNNTVRRTYIVPRADYPAKFVPPQVGTADPKFGGDYIFAGESVQRIDKELDALYVAVVRTYSIPELISYQWDDSIQRTIKITKTIIKARSQTGSQSLGKIVEIQPVDRWIDFRITSEVQWNPDDLNPNGTPKFPIKLDSVAGEANYPFPPLLKSVKLFGVWATATSGEAAPAYAEDFFFEMDTVEPHPGPYSAQIDRYLTDNPIAIHNANPITVVTSRQETFGYLRRWAAASDSGNQAFALARREMTPVCVHDEIELPAVINYTQGGGLADAKGGQGSKTLPATPGFSAYKASSITTAGVETRRSRFGLWEVQVTKIFEGGSTVYRNDQSITRGIVPGTGSGNYPGYIDPRSVYVVWASPVYFFSNALAPDKHIPPAGGTVTVKVWAKQAWNWEFYNPADAAWITPNFAAQVESDDDSIPIEVTFTFAANNTGSARECMFLFVPAGALAAQTFAIYFRQQPL